MKTMYLAMRVRYSCAHDPTGSGFPLRAFKTRKKAEKFLNEYADKLIPEWAENVGETLVDVKPIPRYPKVFIHDYQLDIWEQELPVRILEHPHGPHDENWRYEAFYVRKIDLDLEIR